MAGLMVNLGEIFGAFFSKRKLSSEQIVMYFIDLLFSYKAKKTISHGCFVFSRSIFWPHVLLRS